jgi:DNA-binding transcriptional ArsR family regulator
LDAAKWHVPGGHHDGVGYGQRWLCCEFIEPLGKTQGTISHHLRVLGEAGMVHGERRGKWVWYTLDRERLASLRETIGS